MLSDIFSLGGLVAFLAGVFLSGWVMSLFAKAKSKAAR